MTENWFNYFKAEISPVSSGNWNHVSYKARYTINQRRAKTAAWLLEQNMSGALIQLEVSIPRTFLFFTDIITSWQDLSVKLRIRWQHYWSFTAYIHDQQERQRLFVIVLKYSIHPQCVLRINSDSLFLFPELSLRSVLKHRGEQDRRTMLKKTSYFILLLFV